MLGMAWTVVSLRYGIDWEIAVIVLEIIGLNLLMQHMSSQNAVSVT